MADIADIIYVKTAAFDSLSTEKIAEELLRFNARMRDEGRSYILVGPGRWGSSDPFLGVPVKWTHISGGEGDRRVRHRAFRRRALAGHALLPERYLARRGLPDDQPLPRRRDLPRRAARRPRGRTARGSTCGRCASTARCGSAWTDARTAAWSARPRTTKRDPPHRPTALPLGL